MKFTSKKSFFVYSSILFNMFFMNINSIKILLEIPFIKIRWKLSGYQFSYADEFVKRGFIGTVLKFASIEPNPVIVFIISIVFSNIYFILFYVFSAKILYRKFPKIFVAFIAIFIVSPATAMHLGYDAGRFDHFNLVIMITIIMLLVYDKRAMNYILIPTLISVGLLIHEAFLFINLPIIMAISNNEIKKNRYSSNLLYIEIFATASMMFLILFYGKANSSTIEVIVTAINRIAPNYDPGDSLSVWTRGVTENISLTIPKYASKKTQLYLISIFPLLCLYAFIYKRRFEGHELSLSQKIVFFSPCAILPLFFIGVDFYRWIALMIITMFVSFVYLMKDLEITSFLLSTNEKIAMKLIVLYTFLGPIGITCSFPYFRTLIQMMKSIL